MYAKKMSTHFQMKNKPQLETLVSNFFHMKKTIWLLLREGSADSSQGKSWNV